VARLAASGPHRRLRAPNLTGSSGRRRGGARRRSGLSVRPALSRGRRLRRHDQRRLGAASKAASTSRHPLQRRRLGHALWRRCSLRDDPGETNPTPLKAGAARLGAGIRRARTGTEPLWWSGARLRVWVASWRNKPELKPPRGRRWHAGLGETNPSGSRPDPPSAVRLRADRFRRRSITPDGGHCPRSHKLTFRVCAMGG
jgi:hypothetical protein